MKTVDVVRYFMDKGYQPHQAAAIAGNLTQESSLNPEAINKKSGAYGLPQFLGPRKKALFDYAARQGSYAADPGTQLDFIDHELNTTERKAKGKLMSATNLADATDAFSNYYERAGAAEKNNARRIGFAEKALNFVIPTASASEEPYQAPKKMSWDDFIPPQQAQGQEVVQAPAQPQAQPTQKLSWDDFIPPQANPAPQQAQPEHVKHPLQDMASTVGKHLAKAASNIPQNAVDIATGLFNTVVHPQDTAMNMLMSGTDTAQKVIAHPIDTLIDKFQGAPQAIEDQPLSALLMAAPLLPKLRFLPKSKLEKLSSMDRAAIQADMAAPSDFTEGVLPTAAMKSANNALGELELGQRLVDKPQFTARDIATKQAIAQKLQSLALPQEQVAQQTAAVNTATSPLREQAYQAARVAGPEQYAGPLRTQIDELKTGVGTRYDPATETLTKPANPLLSNDPALIDPADVYRYRKQLADGLNNTNPLASDLMTNAAKSARREATLLKNSTDSGLNQASGGAWQNYLNTHRQGMIPINEGAAFDEALGKFSTAPQLAPGVPDITPARLKQALNQTSTTKSGRTRLTPTGQAEAAKMVETVNALQRAQSPRGAITGSQTTPLRTLLDNGLTGIPKQIAGYGWDLLTGDSQLTAQLLDIAKLEKELMRIKSPKNKAYRGLMAAVGADSMDKKQGGKNK
jgi:hypothetical protein